MRGQLIERGNSTYLVRVFLGRDGSGKRKYMNKTVRGSKRMARKVLTEMLASLDEGTLIEPSRQSLNEYLDQWLKVSAKPRLRPRTFKEYKGLLRRYIRPHLGDMPIGQIEVLDIQGVYSKMLASGLSPRTIEYTNAVLRSALKQAVRWKIIPMSPTDGVDLPKEDTISLNNAANDNPHAIRVLDPDQARTFLRACESHRQGALFSLAITAGLRPSEYLALQWSDIDFLEGTVTVQKSIAYSKGQWSYHPPKTRRSRRVVKLTSPVLQALARHKEVQNKQREKAGSKWEDHGLVFTTRTGRPLMLRNVRRTFKNLLFDLDLPDIRLYDLRHTAATLALMAGIPVKVISEQLGHASTAFTMDIYSHVLPHMQAEAAQRLEAHLWDDERIYNSTHEYAEVGSVPNESLGQLEKSLAHIWHTNAKMGHSAPNDPSSQSPF